MAIDGQSSFSIIISVFLLLEEDLSMEVLFVLHCVRSVVLYSFDSF